MRLYALSFSTENFGNGIALVVASKNKEAFALLQRQGQLNATPEEYTLKASLDISDSNICSPTLIYEEYSGVRTVVGPPGTGIETINVDENGYLVVVLTDGTVQTSTNSLKGPKGDDATINGYNAINIEAGENVTIDQEDNTLTINATNNGTWGSITGNIWNQSDLSTELNKAIISVTTNEDGTIDFTKNNGDVTSVDLNHTHELADLIQDSTHRTVTDAEKASWNSSNIFIATTNTTLEELSDAYDEGKTLFFFANGYFYVLNFSSGEDFYFNCFAADENTVYYAYINSDDGWVLDGDNIPTSEDLYSYYQKPPTGIPETDLSSAVTTKLNATEIFWATYGTTTASEIDAAISSNKLVAVSYSGRIHIFSGIIGTSYYFNCAYGGQNIAGVKLENGTWSNVGSIALQQSSLRVNSWQSTPDNNHYPSEKLVKDSLDAKQATIDSSHKLDYGLLSNTPTIPDAVEPNPTVPSGTTPTSLTGLKIGSGYYDIDVSNVVQHTTAYWDAATGYVPADGEIVVYTDYSTITETVGGQTTTKYVPGIKIGSGNGYVQDLAFVGEDVKDDIIAHLTNTSIHIQTGERTFWNNKLNVNDNQEVVNETLIFNRN